MKKIMKVTMLMLACILIVGVTDVDAQYGKKKKKTKPKEKTETKVEKDNGDEDYFDESGGKLVDMLWYGGGFTLGFSGNQNTSVFGVGVSPMVGYKVTEKISFGPRAVLDYTLYKESFSNGVQRVDLLTYGGGIFGRFKAFKSIFFHTEYTVLNQAFPALTSSFELVTFRQTTNNFYIGGGYHSGGDGGGLGYEIVILYNTLEPDDSIDLPIDFRIGFTWNF